MDWNAVAAVAACVAVLVSLFGFFIYMGRSLGTLNSIKEAVMVALAKVDTHEKAIADVQTRLVRVETKQEDCGTCP